MDTGYIAALATLGSWTISTFIFTKLARLAAPAALNKAALFSGIFLLGIIVCLVDRLPPWRLFTLPGASNWLWLGLSGILGKSIGDYCGFCSLRILGARRRSMITTLGPGFTWLFGLLILNERISWPGIAAILLTTFSLLLLTNSSAEREEVRAEKFGLPLNGLLYGAAGTALTCLAFILSKKTLTDTGYNISAFHATWVRILIAFSAILVYDAIRGKHTNYMREFLFNKQKAGLLFSGVFFGAVLGLSCSLMAITRLNATVAFTIFSLLPVCVIMVSVVFYGKKVSLLSWVYSTLALAGVLALIWSNELMNWL